MVNKNITYPGIITPIGKKGNTEPLLMLGDWSVEERIDKFMDFLHAWDKRDDKLLQHHTQFSHRLHWDENPFADWIKQLDKVEDKLHLTMVYAFTNEHWKTTEEVFNSIIEDRDPIIPETMHSRHDLYQIWFPKGTNVAEFLRTVPKRAAHGFIASLKDKDKRFYMMEFAYALKDYLRATERFRNVLYPCKNIARNLGMPHPEFIDPDSYIHPGTGSFRGFRQIFGEPYLMSKALIHSRGFGLNMAGEELIRQFHVLRDHPRNPITKNQYVNIEDKVCFFFKHLSFTTGYMKFRKETPIDLIIPSTFSFKVV